MMLNPNAIAENRPVHGPVLHPDGSTTFGLWAPAQPRMLLAVANHPDPYVMEPMATKGWHEITLPQLGAGTRYAFVLPDGTRVPDPASHFQPDGVSGLSEVVDPRLFRWRDRDWKGRPWQTAVLYELHVGTFTPEGTFRGVLSRLDHLVALGVTAIELMPIAAFPGRRNWGYDGVFPYACAAAYGHPDELKALVDAAHVRGLMVLLDVVYNHFGRKATTYHSTRPSFSLNAITPPGERASTSTELRVPQCGSSTCQMRSAGFESFISMDFAWMPCTLSSMTVTGTFWMN